MAMAAPLLALAWYDTTPLPNGALGGQTLGPGPELTELSLRLLAAFDEGLHCDVAIHSSEAGAAAFPAAVADAAAAAAAAAVPAHRLVLRRNTCLGLEAATPLAAVVEGVRPEVLRAVVRAHYAELDDPAQDACSHVNGRGPIAQLAAARAMCSEPERSLLEAHFGPLQADAWLPLATTLAQELACPRFADCVLQVCGGLEVLAHKVLVSGAKDGHFFAGAFRWPGAKASVAMPEGLSQEALLPLLQLRYGSDKVDVEHILEMRHFAELFDWPAVSGKCEFALESLLADTGSLDAESLLTVVAHVDKSSGLPARLRAAALSTAVRQWSKVTEVAEANLSNDRCVELNALHRIRNRDGHVCASLEEYLHAAADDLTEWERGLALDAPSLVRKQIESTWVHWHQILFEYGRISGAAVAERWREKIRTVRARIREERALGQSARLQLAPGRIWFEASLEWQEVPQNAVCPGGLEYRCDMQTGRNFARLVA